MTFVLVSVGTLMCLVLLCQLSTGEEDPSNGFGTIKTKEAIDLILAKLDSMDKILSLHFKDDTTTAPSVLSIGKESRIAAIFPRSCQEIFDQNPTQTGATATNGNQYIDPDGPGVGDPPIFVNCVNGTTRVAHSKSNSPMTVNGETGLYNDPGSYSYSVTYGATIRQMSALAALSTSCRQRFTYECKQAYFQFNGVQYSWWLDRYGSKQFFWAGNFKSGTTEALKHTCQCGTPGNKCSDAQFLCNCDIYPTNTTQFTDDGYITEKSLLPVTQLKLGKIVGSTTYTLGDLECSGSVGSQIVQPASCADLYQLGHTLNGYYTVKGSTTTTIETVFCDFSVPAINAGFETRLGVLCSSISSCQSKPNSTSVYFYAQRSSAFTAPVNTFATIPFETEVVNVGGALNLATGVFTAPVDGIYYFSLSGFKCTNVVTVVVFRLLNKTQGTFPLATFPFDSNPNTQKFSVESTLSLKKGDTLGASIQGCLLGVNPFYQTTHFNGRLLKED